jgi:hypothetical protein
MKYQHTQFAYLIVVFMAIIVLPSLLVASFTQPTQAWPVAAMAILLILFAWLFSSLKIEVNEENLVFWFGPGWLRRIIPLAEIVSCKIVRNPWYYGWGIHMTPKGWIYNVSGLRGVEIVLTSGKTLRLGTDEPQALANAINNR